MENFLPPLLVRGGNQVLERYYHHVDGWIDNPMPSSMPQARLLGIIQHFRARFEEYKTEMRLSARAQHILEYEYVRDEIGRRTAAEGREKTPQLASLLLAGHSELLGQTESVLKASLTQLKAYAKVSTQDDWQLRDLDECNSYRLTCRLSDCLRHATPFLILLSSSNPFNSNRVVGPPWKPIYGS